MAPPPADRRSRSIFGSVFGSRARPRSTAATMSAPAFDRSMPFGNARSSPSASAVFGAARAISIMMSSLRTRDRGTSRPCASASRQPASSIRTGEIARFAGAVAKPLPSPVGVLLVGRSRRQRAHLVGEPAEAVRRFELLQEELVDVAKVGHVRDRVDDLRFRQRSPRPVSKARGFVELDLADRLNEVGIGDLVAEPADHRRDLRVEQRHRDHLGEVPEDLDVLPSRMEDLDHVGIGHQVEQGLEVDAVRQCVDGGSLVVGRELDDAKLRPERRFAQEFRVDGDVGVGGEAVAELRQVLRRGDQLHLGFRGGGGLQECRRHTRRCADDPASGSRHQFCVID